MFLRRILLQQRRLLGTLCTPSRVHGLGGSWIPERELQPDPTRQVHTPMKKFQKFLALAALTPFLAACTPSNEDVCNHVMDIMKKEMGDAEGAKELSEEDVKKYTEKCVKDLEKEKEKKGADAYKKQMKCVMAASKMDELVKCDEGDKDAEKKEE